MARGLNRLTYRAQSEQAYMDWERLYDAAIILGFRDLDDGELYVAGVEFPPHGTGWRAIDKKIGALCAELGVVNTRQAVDEANAYMHSLDPTCPPAISTVGLPKAEPAP